MWCPISISSASTISYIPVLSATCIGTISDHPSVLSYKVRVKTVSGARTSRVEIARVQTNERAENCDPRCQGRKRHCLCPFAEVGTDRRKPLGFREFIYIESESPAEKDLLCNHEPRRLPAARSIIAARSHARCKPSIGAEETAHGMMPIQRTQMRMNTFFLRWFGRNSDNNGLQLIADTSPKQDLCKTLSVRPLVHNIKSSRTLDRWGFFTT